MTLTDARPFFEQARDRAFRVFETADRLAVTTDNTRAHELMDDAADTVAQLIKDFSEARKRVPRGAA